MSGPDVKSRDHPGERRRSGARGIHEDSVPQTTTAYVE